MRYAIVIKKRVPTEGPYEQWQYYRLRPVALLVIWWINRYSKTHTARRRGWMA